MFSKLVLLITGFIFFVSYQIPAIAAGSAITDYHPNNVKYRLYTEDFSPSSDSRVANNIGTWSFNNIDEGDIDRNNGFGRIVQSGDGKYAVDVSRWSTTHPSFGTHTLFSEFTGNYFNKNVVSLSFEARVSRELLMKKDRPITLALRGKDGFTLYKTMFHCEPARNRIDCQNVPELPIIWTKFTFSIPKTFAQAKQEGWGVYNLNNHGDSYKLQNYFSFVMEDVQKVDFIFGAPSLVYAFQEFHIEATKVTITTALKP